VAEVQGFIDQTVETVLAMPANTHAETRQTAQKDTP
jgi:hypothetical protein